MNIGGNVVGSRSSISWPPLLLMIMDVADKGVKDFL